MCGSPALAVGPMSALSVCVGTCRQPTSFWPCAAMNSSTTCLAACSLGRIRRQKHDAGGELARLRQLGAELLLHHAAQELVRQGREDAGAVARVRLAAAGAAVVHVAQHFLGIDQNLVAALAFDVGDEADAARIVLVRRVVQALLRRRAERRSLPHPVLL